MNTAQSVTTWQPIDTAPKNVTTFLAMWNINTNLFDIAHWCSGEWSSIYGNGDMTHWRHLRDGEFTTGPYGYPTWKHENATAHH